MPVVPRSQTSLEILKENQHSESCTLVCNIAYVQTITMTYTVPKTSQTMVPLILNDSIPSKILYYPTDTLQTSMKHPFAHVVHPTHFFQQNTNSARHQIWYTYDIFLLTSTINTGSNKTYSQNPYKMKILPTKRNPFHSKEKQFIQKTTHYGSPAWSPTMSKTNSQKLQPKKK